MHRHVRLGLQSSKVDTLAIGSAWIIWSPRDDGREVADTADAVLREQPPAQGIEVKPLVRRALEAAVVQVEAVDVDVREQHQRNLHRDNRRARGRSCRFGGSAPIGYFMAPVVPRLLTEAVPVPDLDAGLGQFAYGAVGVLCYLP